MQLNNQTPDAGEEILRVVHSSTSHSTPQSQLDPPPSQITSPIGLSHVPIEVLVDIFQWLPNFPMDLDPRRGNGSESKTGGSARGENGADTLSGISRHTARRDGPVPGPVKVEKEKGNKHNWKLLSTLRFVSHSFALAVSELMERILLNLGCVGPCARTGQTARLTQSYEDALQTSGDRRLLLSKPISFSKADMLRALLILIGVPRLEPVRRGIAATEEGMNEVKVSEDEDEPGLSPQGTDIALVGFASSILRGKEGNHEFLLSVVEIGSGFFHESGDGSAAFAKVASSSPSNTSNSLGTVLFPYLLPFPRLERIGDNCCTRVSFQQLRSVALVNLESLRSIGRGFFAKAQCSVEELQLGPGLPNLEVVGDSFFFGCATLRIVAFRELHSLTKIGDDFLVGCWRIRKVDLTECRNLRIIGDRFCAVAAPSSYLYCRPVSSLACVLLPTHSLHRMGCSFCAGCGTLSKTNASVAFTRGHEVSKEEESALESSSSEFDRLLKSAERTIGARFLKDCECLTAFPLGEVGFPDVDVVGAEFLAGVRWLTALEGGFPTALAPGSGGGANKPDGTELASAPTISRLKRIESSFASYCFALTKLMFIDCLPFLRIIEDDFARECVQLKTVHMTKLRQLERIGSQFLFGCRQLIELRLCSAEAKYFDLASSQGPPSIAPALLTPLLSTTRRTDLPKTVRLYVVDSKESRVSRSEAETSAGGYHEGSGATVSSHFSVGAKFLSSCGALESVQVSSRFADDAIAAALGMDY